MKNLTFWPFLALFGLFLALLTSCDPCKRIAKYESCFPADTVVINNTIIQRDSITFTQPDTMAISLLFECDSNNNVLMRELNDISSKGIQTKVVFKDNRLDISGYVDSIAILNKLIETTRNKEVIKINPINPVLKADNEKLTNRNKLKNKILMGLSIFILLLLIVIKLK